MIQESETSLVDEKVKSDSTDTTPGYLDNKIDTNTLDVDTSNHVLKVKDNTFVKISGDTMTGHLTMTTGSFSGSTKSAGYFYTGTTDPSNTDRLNYDGYLYATRIYNPVYNDIVDFYDYNSPDNPLPGMVYTINENGNVVLCSRDDIPLGICSDTFGLSVGKVEDKSQIPIGISGNVLSFVDKEYPPLTPLKVGRRRGILTKCSWFDRIFNRDKIVGYYLKKEKLVLWNGNIKVNGRHWVKIK